MNHWVFKIAIHWKLSESLKTQCLQTDYGKTYGHDGKVFRENFAIEKQEIKIWRKEKWKMTNSNENEWYNSW